MRKHLLFLLILILSIVTALPIAADSSDVSDDIVILYTNDIHTYINGDIRYDTIAGVKSYLETIYDHVLLVDAGDHIQGTVYGSMDKGESIIRMMNAAGYDLATLGNHEFDYTMEGRIRVTDEWAEFPYVSCNFRSTENGIPGETVLEPYRLFALGEDTLAVIGITTPETFTKSTPAYFQDENGNFIYSISGGTDGAALYADVQSAIDSARAAGADRVIAIGHLGDDLSSAPWRSEDTIANVRGLDAFIDGHSHATVPYREAADLDGNPVVLTQTGEYFNAIGMMVIDGKTGEIRTELLSADHEILAAAVPDENVKAICDAWINEVNSALDIKIGEVEVTLDNYDADGNRIVRTQETNTGDFTADALYYLFDNMGLDVDAAILNGGGIRNTAITGDFTYLTGKLIHTFGNVACLQTVTGQQLLDALEWGARQAPDVQVGGFLQISGITFEIDTSVVSTVQMDTNGIWIGGPTGEYRVKNVKIFNKETNTYEPLDLFAKYNLAGYNYALRDLGDGYAMFDGAVNVLDYVMEDYMVLANYITGFDNCTVGTQNSPLNQKYPGFGSNYAERNGSGRITFSNTAEPAWDGKITIGGLTSNVWFTKYGNVYTDCPANRFTEELGLSWGDLAAVQFLGQTLILPVVPTYAYAESGCAAIILGKSDNGQPTGYVSLAINMGSFGETYGLGHKITDENRNWHWVAAENVTYPVDVTFALAEKEGYMAEYLQYDLHRTNVREDYPHLTDEAYANFRAIKAPELAENILFRISSPINPEIGRNTFALTALQNAGVNVILNLADSAESAASYPGFADSYYADQKVCYLSLGVDAAEDVFAASFASGLRFIAENPGVYAIHCNEGKDRTGLIAALLAAFCGASYEEIIADYMLSYVNYYGVESGSDAYRKIASSNIEKTLCAVLETENLQTANLKAAAENYFRAIGLTDAELDSLRSNLRGITAEEPETPADSEIPDNEQTMETEELRPHEPEDESSSAPETADNGWTVCIMAGLLLTASAAILRRRNSPTV